MGRIPLVVALTFALMAGAVATGPGALAKGKPKCTVKPSTSAPTSCQLIAGTGTVTVVSTLDSGGSWVLNNFGSDNPKTCGCFGNGMIGSGAGSGTTVLGVGGIAGSYLQLYLPISSSSGEVTAYNTA
jgi:hypothetical protein